MPLSSVNTFNQWIDNTGWVHYYPQSDARQYSEGFGDSPHATAFYIVGSVHAWLKPKDMEAKFTDGAITRNAPKGFIRHPRTINHELGRHQTINRDQSLILWPLRMYQPYIAAQAYEFLMKKKWVEFLWPHHRIFLERAMGFKTNYILRLVGDVFEALSYLTDYIVPTPTDRGKKNRSDSSKVKNVFRVFCAMHNQPTFITRWLWKKIKKSGKKPMRDYFTFAHYEDIDSPPPLHLLWEPILNGK